MAKATKKRAGGKYITVDGIEIREFSSYTDYYEFDTESNDSTFDGVRIDRQTYNLPYDVYIDLTHSRMMIGCNNRSLAEWQKLSQRATKKLAANENLTKDHVAAYQEILNLALKMVPSSAKIDELRARLAALEEESHIKSMEIAKSLVGDIAKAANVPDEDEESAES